MKLGKTSIEGCYTFWCPGCEELHSINSVIHPDKGMNIAWGFNGNFELPTFTPSLLIRGGHYCPGQKGKDCWCTYHKEHPEAVNAPICFICHSFITNGKIQYLNDCTHKLAGQTVEMKDIELTYEVSK